MDIFRGLPVSLVTAEQAIEGRDTPVNPHPGLHAVFGTPIDAPQDPNLETIYLAMGCFWGVEKLYWSLPAVVSTAVGYQGGFTKNPTYQEVCTGLTGHTETVRVTFDPTLASCEDMLVTFWENHDPTSGYRQGNDIGTQYRSAIFYTTDNQHEVALSSQERFARQLSDAGFGPVTTTILSAAEAGPFYLAEDYHQQYLIKNPNGYCPVHATGIKCR